MWLFYFQHGESDSCILELQFQFRDVSIVHCYKTNCFANLSAQETFCPFVVSDKNFQNRGIVSKSLVNVIFAWF